MKYRRFAFALLITLIAGIGLTAQAQKQTQAEVRWEYKTVKSCNQADPQLGELGDQGWELVTAYYDSYGNCTYHRLKRQKPKDAPAYVPPEKHPAPRCQLTLDQAPAIRGFRLGMNVNEVLALMPESGEKQEIKNKLEKAPLIPSFGFTDFSLSVNTILQTPSNLERFAGISIIRFSVLDNRVVNIQVSYLSRNLPVRPDWNAETLIAKFSLALGLPDLTNWERISGREAKLICRGFEVFASANGDYVFITVNDSSYSEKLAQRIAAEQERLRREFKP
ncbi:MAG TPA: hypothetical protein VFD58_14110 [Blastocatellia bacterium]|nr:hypothetical protein [Blastocatellia bacterium]